MAGKRRGGMWGSDGVQHILKRVNNLTDALREIRKAITLDEFVLLYSTHMSLFFYEKVFCKYTYSSTIYVYC